METPLRTAARLLDALEDLIGREGALLRAGEFAKVASLQKRINPLIVKLCSLGAANLAALRPRVDALRERRRILLSNLKERRTFLMEERRRVADMGSRLRTLRPYARPA